MAKEKIYGFSAEDRPLRTQREVVKDYMLHHPGKYNAISHNDCERLFGFRRLSAIIFNIHKDVPVHREKRVKPTRYEGITSEPTYYWIEEGDAARVLNEAKAMSEEFEKNQTSTLSCTE